MYKNYEEWMYRRDLGIDEFKNNRKFGETKEDMIERQLDEIDAHRSIEEQEITF